MAIFPVLAEDEVKEIELVRNPGVSRAKVGHKIVRGRVARHSEGLVNKVLGATLRLRRNGRGAVRLPRAGIVNKGH